MIVNFVSDLATPHVNELLRAVVARGDVTLRLWYAVEELPELYSWKRNPTHEIQRAEIFGRSRPSLRLIQHILQHPEERTVIVGWMNPTTQMLIPLLTAAGRQFAYFTDQPIDSRSRGRLRWAVREAYYKMLKRGAVVFAAGRKAESYFLERGFSPRRVFNIRIPVPSLNDLASLRGAKSEVRRKYGVPEGGLLIVTGSRLIRDKGFDLMLSAIADLPDRVRLNTRVVLIGHGPEQEALSKMADALGVRGQVTFEPWMEMEDFARSLAASDFTVHPARFDAYGGISVTAVALGVPVVGALGAGAAFELVEHGRNGYLYEANDVATLSRHIVALFDDRDTLASMSREAYEVAEKFSPNRVADAMVVALNSLARSEELNPDRGCSDRI